MIYNKNTKIVCTLGPSTNSVTEITDLVQAGMNVARLNFSHGDYTEHASLIANIHKIEKKIGKKIGILQDLQGPKIRLGELPKDGIEVKRGDRIILSPKNFQASVANKKMLIPIQYKEIFKDLKKGNTVFINDGLIEAKVEKINKPEVICRIICGGILKSRNGVNIPDAKISLPALTEKDKKDLAFGLAQNVDFIALSFVRNEKDIKELRKLIKSHKKSTPIVAKIERPEAVQNLEQIILASDGVMVARGDLGVNIPPEKVPIVQKAIIHLANKHAKPVITATHVLNSMVENPFPTRAEISDAANAVFDHTDAIMLSNETAVGHYPIRAAATLSKVASAVEKELKKHQELMDIFVAHREADDPYCTNACEMATSQHATLLAVYTDSGFSARHIAKHRSYIPTVIMTPNEHVARELTLVWGLNKVFVVKFRDNMAQKSKAILEFLKKEKLIKKGNKIIILCNASSKERTISSFIV